MIIHTRRRKFTALLSFHLFAWGASAYFVNSAYTGDRGLLAKHETREKTDQIIAEISALRQERSVWERRVNQLSGSQIDQDLLDERLRLMINASHRNDVIILLDKNKK